MSFVTGTILLKPGEHVSSMYSLDCAEGVGFSAGSDSKPVPPVGRRMNRFVMGAVRGDPGRKDSAPFVAVHSSRAIQKPRADGGSVYYDLRKRISHEKVGNALGKSYLEIVEP